MEYTDFGLEIIKKLINKTDFDNPKKHFLWSVSKDEDNYEAKGFFNENKFTLKSTIATIYGLTGQYNSIITSFWWNDINLVSTKGDIQNVRKFLIDLFKALENNAKKEQEELQMKLLNELEDLK